MFLRLLNIVDLLTYASTSFGEGSKTAAATLVNVAQVTSETAVNTAASNPELTGALALSSAALVATAVSRLQITLE